MKHVLMLAILLMAIPACVHAHATAERSEPKVGSELTKPPTEIRIWFSEELEPAFSKIMVFAPDGKEIDKKDTHVDPKDKRVLIVSLPPKLLPGAYHVHWHVVSIDTHRTQNEFKFNLKP